MDESARAPVREGKKGEGIVFLSFLQDVLMHRFFAVIRDMISLCSLFSLNIFFLSINDSLYVYLFSCLR